MNLPPNSFLKSLSAGDFELLRPHLHALDLPSSKVLFDQGGLIDQVYFPNGGVVSLVEPEKNLPPLTASVAKPKVIASPGISFGTRRYKKPAQFPVSGTEVSTATLQEVQGVGNKPQGRSQC